MERKVFLVSSLYRVKSGAEILINIFQRVSQLQRPHQGQGVGRGQRPQGEAAAEVDQGERRLPRTDDYRGADPVWRDGRLVSPREEVRQVLRVRLHQAADQCRD